MTPIYRLPMYLLRLDDSVHVVEGYINTQLDLLHTYPYGGSQYSPTGGVLGKSNTDRAQVYINRTVKYII